MISYLIITFFLQISHDLDRVTLALIQQLLSTDHEILIAFDKGLEVRGIFLDISMAF